VATNIRNSAEQHLPAGFVSVKPRSGKGEGDHLAGLRAGKADSREGDGLQPVKRYPGIVRVGIALGGAAACWAIIAGVLAAVN
jgi:hypothetical protein